jgi:hypothetical protein
MGVSWIVDWRNLGTILGAVLVFFLDPYLAFSFPNLNTCPLPIWPSGIPLDHHRRHSIFPCHFRG